MSKSKHNYIAVTEDANSMFGKVMSLPDEAMEPYMKSVSGWGPGETARRLAALRTGGCHPMELKIDLAKAIVERFHSPAAAGRAELHFRESYQRKGDSAYAAVSAAELLSRAELAVLDLVLHLEPGFSKAHAKRMIAQSAVRIDGTACTSFDAPVRLHAGQKIEIGKHKKVKLV
jgi:tyrosyl-tRNA synthetase